MVQQEQKWATNNMPFSRMSDDWAVLGGRDQADATVDSSAGHRDLKRKRSSHEMLNS